MTKNESKISRKAVFDHKWEYKEYNSSDTAAWENPFEDVKSYDWYYPYVEYAVKNSIFNGVTDTAFVPDGIITRARMVTVLSRAEGESETADTATFEDVDSTAYYAKATVRGQQNGRK